MFRHQAIPLLGVFLFAACESQAARDAHDKTLIAAARQEEKADLEQLTAAQGAAEAEKKSTEERVAAEKKSAEDHAAAEKVAVLRADVGANPARYVEFSGLAFSENRIPQGDRHLMRVYGTNKSPYTLRVAEASVIVLDSSGKESAAAPLSLNGSIAPGQTKTFQEADIRSGIIPGKGKSVRVAATAVEIIDVAQIAIQ